MANSVYVEAAKRSAFPLSVIAFFSLFLIVYNTLGLPSPNEIVSFGRSLFEEHGVWIVAIGAFLETLFVASLYLPGSFAILLGIIFSNKTLEGTVELIVFIWAGMLLASIVNFVLGRSGYHKLLSVFAGNRVAERFEGQSTRERATKTFLSGFHPNILSFATVSLGIAGESAWRAAIMVGAAIAFWVPFMVIVVGLVSSEIEENSDSAIPVLFGILALWFIIDYFLSVRHLRRAGN